MTIRARFRLAFASLAAILALTYLAFVALPLKLPSAPVAAAASVDEADWGHVRALDGAFQFMLAPNTDQRRKYELGFGRVTFTSAGVIVADDEHMTNAVVLNGEPMGNCGYHWQGRGVNVIAAINRCVPAWATVTGSTGHAQQWIRAECLRPKPCVVVVKYG